MGFARAYTGKRWIAKWLYEVDYLNRAIKEKYKIQYEKYIVQNPEESINVLRSIIGEKESKYLVDLVIKGNDEKSN